MTQAGSASLYKPVFFTMTNWSWLPRKRENPERRRNIQVQWVAVTTAMELGRQ